MKIPPILPPALLALVWASLSACNRHENLQELELRRVVGTNPEVRDLVVTEQYVGHVRSPATEADNESVWVEFNVPEARYLEFMAGQGKSDDATIELMLANGQKFDQTGTIGAIEAEFNSKTGSIPFRADFPNPDRLLRDGQSGIVLIHRTRHNALVVPQRAVFEVLARRYVYVVDGGNVVHQREIALQSEQDDVFLVETGLDANDRIVLEGVRQVRDGEKVEYSSADPKSSSAI